MNKKITVEDVFEELRLQDDALHKWAQKHKELFIPLDDQIQKQATTILNSHPNLIDLKKRNGNLNRNA